jgi:hypothetical protein
VCLTPHPDGPSTHDQGDEVTVGFNRWHTHGEPLDGGAPRAHLIAALELVERVLEDEVRLAVSCVDGQLNDALEAMRVLELLEQRYWPHNSAP